MKYMNVVFGALILAIQGCGTDGPILGYQDSADLDKESISIIYLPPAIDLLELDGVKKDSPFIENGYNELHVAPGQHQIALRYTAYWGDNTAGNVVKSKPVALSLRVSPKSKYYLRYKQPKDIWQAEELAGSFSPWVEDASGTKLTGVKRLAGGDLLTTSVEKMDTALPVQPKGTNPLDNLKYWWKQAGYTDKKSFEKWMSEN